VRHADGHLIEVYCTDCGEYMADFSDCLGSPDCGVNEGQRFTEALVDALGDIDLDIYDGLSTDGFWNNPGPWGPLSGIDLDRNGVDDNDEHGYDWVIDAWTTGTSSFISRLHERIGPDQFLVINSGAFHSWWWDLHNGPLLEGAWALYSWDYFLNNYRTWMESAREPHLLVVDGKPSYDQGNGPDDRGTYYRLMRFLLGTTMLGDGYFEFSDSPGNSHNWIKYYDELDLDIGYPTTSPVEIADNVYVRFFTGAVLILNATSSTVEVADSDISSLDGYDGPYFRFRGGQDPGHNDGSAFDQVTLVGSVGTNEDGAEVIVGDAIILPVAAIDVIADIIIDDRGAGTSPGSDAAELTGSWEPLTLAWANRNHAWHTGPPWDASNAFFAGAGSGETRVDYRPTVGLAGSYEVFLFHGELENDDSLATNMPCRVTHAGGEETVLVDLNAGIGEWTRLGEYRFSEGEGGLISCSDDADGAVIADAVRLTFIGR